MPKNEDKRPADREKARQAVKNAIEAAFRPAAVPLVWLWDARPLEADSWGNILGLDDGQGGGDFIDMRLWLCTTPRPLVNEPPMYRPAHAALPPFFKSGGVRRCYRPTDEDTAAVQRLYPAHQNPHAPPWFRIEADLIVAGYDRDRLVKLSPPALLSLLRRVREQEDTADGATLQKPDAGADEWNKLTDRQRDCLCVLWQGKALNADSRLRADDIAMKAEGHCANVNGFKAPLSDLVLRGLVESKTGREGGYWLTIKGQNLAAKNIPTIGGACA